MVFFAHYDQSNESNRSQISHKYGKTIENSMYSSYRKFTNTLLCLLLSAKKSLI